MRILKLAVISAVILFLVITALSALIPSHVRISRAINIYSKTSPAQYINDLKRWKEWNVFIQQADSSDKGSTSTNTSIQSNNLSVMLLSASPDSISTSWQQGGGRKFESRFIFLKGENYTTVQWYFDFHLKWYPWEKFQSIIYDQEMGPEMEASLTELKRKVESSP